MSGSFGYNESQNQSTSSGRTGGYQESGGLTMSRGTGSSSGSTSSFSSSTPGFMTELGSILDRNLKGEGPYSKSAAIADSQGVLRTNAQDALQQALPAIYRSDKTAGAYNSTTNELLQNDLTSRIVAQGQQMQLNAIKDYGTIGNQQIAAFSGATQAGTTQAGGSSGSNSSTQDQTSIGLNSSIGVNEGVNQAQASGDSMGFNIAGGIGGAADGGVLGTWDNVSPHSLVSAGDSIFTLIPNFLGPDGTGKKTGNLSILPQLLATVGMELGVPEGATAERGLKDGEKPAAATGPNLSGDVSEYAKLSKGAIEFLKANDFKDMDEAAAAMGDSNKIWGVKDLYKTADIKEFKGDGVAALARQRVTGDQGTESTGGYADGGTVMADQNTAQAQQQATAARSLLALILGTGAQSQNSLVGQTNQAREVNAGLQEPNAAGQGGIVINVNGGSSGNQAPGTAVQRPQGGDAIKQGLRGMFGFADGGQIADTQNLVSALQQFAGGGQIPQLNQMTNSAGKIGGPQSQSGRDNQVVKVAGGEGVIPVDVMQQPGVPEMLQSLIQKFHRPVQ